MQIMILAADQVRDLRALAGAIIPPSPAYDVPGADDELIFAEILKSLERDRDDICRALSHLATIGRRRLRRSRSRSAAPRWQPHFAKSAARR